MDGRREAVPGAVSPYGRRRWLGGVLGALCLWGSLWTVLDRVLARMLGGLESYEALTGALGYGAGALFLLLFVLAARGSESLPDKGAFLALALGEVLMVFAPLGHLARAAGFLVLYLCRENCRDARTAALIAGALQLIQAICALGAQAAAAWMLGGAVDAGYTLLMLCGNGAFFAAIAGGVVTGLLFWLLRSSMPDARYPEKNRI